MLRIGLSQMHLYSPGLPAGRGRRLVGDALDLNAAGNQSAKSRLTALSKSLYANVNVLHALLQRNGTNTRRSTRTSLWRSPQMSIQATLAARHGAHNPVSPIRQAVGRFVRSRPLSHRLVPLHQIAQRVLEGLLCFGVPISEPGCVGAHVF